jgi:hypothetical protein
MAIDFIFALKASLKLDFEFTPCRLDEQLRFHFSAGGKVHLSPQTLGLGNM